MICPKGKNNIVATTSRQGSSSQQQQMDKVIEEYRYIFTSPVEGASALSGQTPHRYDPRCVAAQCVDLLVLFLENDEIKRQI
jgi:hypothetical protein